MKNQLYIIQTLVFGMLFFLASCGGDDEDPQPVTIKFSTSSASFDGSSISPVPSYTLTVNFDGNGVPTTYTATGSSRTTPTAGNSGTWSVSGTVITFSDSNGATREVNGTINTTTSSVTLDYNVTKLDQGVITDEVGNYVFVMSAI